jgi:hypothetical protein
MASKNGSTPPVGTPDDFLGLTDSRLVVAVDLNPVGRNVIYYVREISTAEKEYIMGRPKGKTRVGKGMVELDWSQMPQGAAAKFLKVCLVTDETGQKQMYDAWLEKLVRPHLVMEKLEEIPNSVSDYIIQKCREISRMTDDDNEERDEIEEKKENS